MPDTLSGPDAAVTPTIDTLLARRGARRFGTPGNVDRAETRRALSLRLWKSWGLFFPLRRHLDDQRPTDPRLRGSRPFRPRGDAQRRLVEHLRNTGYIEEQDPGFWRMVADPDRQTYLSGGWLEELGLLAVRAAGADEAVFAQRIEWTVGNHVGFNEIDVLARKGDVLSVMSCKTADPVYRPDREHQREQFRHFLLEADYWDQHFAAGEGRAVLLVSTDLFDERAHAWRCPTLAARARVLDTDLIGTDHDRWEDLVAALRAHWDEVPATVGA
ncbi:hypothetical protein [Roseospira navarrensis]|uniref:Uncharacterized protein n=1 Tax=Roseospira navarrensis TaxID=140058 RepID=A0A7X2D4S5_9PROT|nr:hypothetical protein [Roseospira navarrensis]MQX38166.1 hypothetical protein [Roseospira navarrensis]